MVRQPVKYLCVVSTGRLRKGIVIWVNHFWTFAVAFGRRAQAVYYQHTHTHTRTHKVFRLSRCHSGMALEGFVVQDC